VPLARVTHVVERFVKHLARANERDTRERQLDIMRDQSAAPPPQGGAVAG
jgi:hypothetical protein